MPKKSKEKAVKKETSKIKLQSDSDQSEGSCHDIEQIQIQGKTRKENSLATLTKMFIDLIKTKSGYKIDLNEAASELGVQKRRIYDITNVMQGVGYVQKLHKNTIRFLGSTQDPHLTTQTKQNQAEIARLAKRQRQIDIETEQMLRKMKSDMLQQSQQYYIDQQDLKGIVYGQCGSYPGVFILQPQQGAQLESCYLVRKDKYEIFVQSQKTISIYCIDKQQLRYVPRFKQQQSNGLEIKNEESIYQDNRQFSLNSRRESEGISRYIKLQNEMND